MGGVLAGGLCICLAICICMSICCCCSKKSKNHTAVDNAASENTVQPAAVILVSETTALHEQQGTQMPEYSLMSCDPTLQRGYTASSATYTVPEPYSTAGGTLPAAYSLPNAKATLPVCPQAGGTFPRDPSYPPATGATLPPTYPMPEGTLPSDYPTQQPYSAQMAYIPPTY